MKTTPKVIFASALMLAAATPTLSHAAYFVDETKTWALETRAQDVMDKVTPRERNLYGTGNTSVPGIGVDKDDTTPKSK